MIEQTFEIVSRFTLKVIATVAAETLKAGIQKLVASGANLYGADLSGADLSGANLSGAILYSANLYSANLSGAILYSANLYGADLSGADLSGADLFRANLSGAILYSANLYGANLSGADLSGADLFRAILYSANLYGATLYGADLSGADLSGAILSGADLSGAKNLKLPTGELFSEYLTVTLPALLTAGGKTLESFEVPWMCHDWENCPMAHAFDVHNAKDAPALLRPRVDQFVQLFDAKQIPWEAVKALIDAKAEGEKQS